MWFRPIGQNPELQLLVVVPFLLMNFLKMQLNALVQCKHNFFFTKKLFNSFLLNRKTKFHKQKRFVIFLLRALKIIKNDLLMPKAQWTLKYIHTHKHATNTVVEYSNGNKNYLNEKSNTNTNLKKQKFLIGI